MDATPQTPTPAAAAASLADDSTNAVTAPKIERFDAVMHQRVGKLRKAGIPTDLGEQFGHLVVGLRSFSHPAIVGKQEQLEKAKRATEGIRDQEPLPAVLQTEVNKRAVFMAVVGIFEGEITPTPEMLEVAQRNGFRIEEDEAGKFVKFGPLLERENSPPPEACREFLSLLAGDNDSLPLRLITASRQLGDVKDRVIDAAGKAFVLGRHVAVDWLD